MIINFLSSIQTLNIIFISFIDTYTIFQGKYESMIQFYIRGVSFVANCYYKNIFPDISENLILLFIALLCNFAFNIHSL